QTSHKQDTTLKENVTILSIITKKINQLPEAERKLLEHGSIYVELNAVLPGLIVNSLFLCILNMTQVHIAAGLPMAEIPFLIVHVFYRSFVNLSLN
uniref:Transmembrane protein 126A n=1 Tax=Piliocolobus tephrosceles TaxID=591936 RepID=A0A8C9HLD6_9PRIM